MCVGHLGPAVAQLGDVDDALLLVVGGRRAGVLNKGLRLVVETEVFDDLVVGGDIRRRAQVQLVHGIAPLVEELQALARFAAVVGLGHGKGMRPGAREDAQVDLFAEHDAGHLAGRDLFVDADLLVNGALVAGQRHDLAQFLGAQQEAVGVRVDAHRGQTTFGGDEGRLRNAELGRDVALAHFRVLGAVGTDFGRGGTEALGHCHLPICSGSVCLGG
ncbi:hypothetical protein D3C87_1413010 [compost metagenome]